MPGAFSVLLERGPQGRLSHHVDPPAREGLEATACRLPGSPQVTERPQLADGRPAGHGDALAVRNAAAIRLLVSVGPTPPSEVRLLVQDGPLAGSEIHLRLAPPGIDATVLTRLESSRQTLSVAMQEVARRLQQRGLVVRTTVAQAGRGEVAHDAVALRARPDVGEDVTSTGGGAR